MSNLYHALRGFRNQLADQLGLPAYKILNNNTLEELAHKQPHTLTQLKDIKGFGPVKISQYGKQFLDIIQSHAHQQNNQQTQTRHSKLDSGPQTTEQLSNSTSTASINNQEIPYIFTISEYLELTNQMLSQAKVVIQGEITSISDRGNYIFFTITDPHAEANLSCFIWGHKMQSLGISLQEGMQLKALGYGRIYPARGSFSFEVENLQVIGEGHLQAAFEQLLRQLEQEGLFKPELKTPIPPYTKNIGLITSKHGDALNDFRTHLGNYGHQVYHYHAHVEGLHAESEIKQAIKYFNQYHPHLDALVITRGGGSLESLSAYNSADLARAIRASRIPTITAIGHHNDTTIADLVADHTCSTPTAAGRFLADPWQQAAQNIATSHKQMTQYFTTYLSKLRQQIIEYQTQIVQSLQARIEQDKNTLKNTYATLTSYLKNLNKHYQYLSRLINAQNPQIHLAQGYSITLDEHGHIIKSINQLKVGQQLQTRFHHGTANTIIKTLNPKP